MAGFPALTTESMPAGYVLFGDFSSVIIGEWGALELQVNPYAGFQAGIVGVRGMWTVDIGFRTKKSFSLATGVT